MSQAVVAELAPTGVLRAGINTQNFLLVSGRDDDGLPVGVAPSMARAIGDRLGVPVQLVEFKSAKQLGDAVNGGWDIALLGAEPARAERIAFTQAYCEIEASYLVRDNAKLNTIADVDKPGVRIAVSAGSAYDLWLTRNIKQAELVHAPNIAASFELFIDQKLDALAGLRTWLMQEGDKLSGMRILDGQFTAVQQAVGTRRGNTASADFLDAFVSDAKKTGLIAGFIKQHGIKGLSVAPLT